MKHFPFRAAIVCLILTPLLYIATLSLSQIYLERIYLNKIQEIFIGDSNTLLNGQIQIQDQIDQNINTFVRKNLLLSHSGVNLNIQVITENGKIIYPTYIGRWDISASPDAAYDSQSIAEENYAILNARPRVRITLHIEHGSLYANFFLLLYALVSFLIFYTIYTKASKKAFADRQAQYNLIRSLQSDEKRQEKILKQLNGERETLIAKIKSLRETHQKDRQQAQTNEEDLFNEIVTLEEQLKEVVKAKEAHDEEVRELKHLLEKHERRKGGKSRRNEFDFLSKRFTAIYKHITMNRKAITGYMGLNDEQQIKAEEIIHQLDLDPDSVIVKRKVFSGKKHKNTAFEVLFAYNGRLYFQKLPNRMVEVVVIGTKNTQKKDMEFLHNL